MGTEHGDAFDGVVRLSLEFNLLLKHFFFNLFIKTCTLQNVVIQKYLYLQYSK